MTTGQMLFGGGIGLFVLTIILAIIFSVKKPQYAPENMAYTGPGSPNTRNFRNGYPTDPLTIRREPAAPNNTPAAGTIPLASATLPLPDGTVPLTASEGAAAPPAGATMPLSGTTAPPADTNL